MWNSSTLMTADNKVISEEYGNNLYFELYIKYPTVYVTWAQSRIWTQITLVFPLTTCYNTYTTIVGKIKSVTTHIYSCVTFLHLFSKKSKRKFKSFWIFLRNLVFFQILWNRKIKRQNKKHHNPTQNKK